MVVVGHGRYGSRNGLIHARRRKYPLSKLRVRVGVPRRHVHHDVSELPAKDANANDRGTRTMSNTDQYYRLAGTWTRKDWPTEINEKKFKELNAVLPDGFHFSHAPVYEDGAVEVELYEYAGEADGFNDD